MAQLFISYSHKDEGFVRRLARDLRFLGVDLWIDFAKLQVGDSLIERLRQGIDDVEFVAAVISANSISSPWVQRELDIAMNQEISGKRVKVLPLLLDNSELPGFLLGKVYLDFQDAGNYEFGLAKLVTRLDLDFDPLPAPRFERHAATTSDADHTRAYLYNVLAMQILEFAGKWESQPIRSLRTESWRRRDDGATYAFESGDPKLLKESTDFLEEYDVKHADILHLFSPQGVLMREAVRLFREAADLGDPEARWNLGWRYELGEGVPKNHNRAVFLWTQAARMGHQASKDKLVELEL